MAKEEKDKFALLDDEFKSAIQGMNAVDIKKRVAEIALNNAELMKAKKEDQDLKEKKDAYADASFQYREGAKMNKLRIDFCKAILDSMGQG